MVRIGLIGLMLAGASLNACASDRYSGNDRQIGRAVTGAAIGAAAGAGVGAAVDGVTPAEGAIVGAIAGGTIGAVTGQRTWRRDDRGYCYYVDDRGERIYDYNKGC